MCVWCDRKPDATGSCTPAPQFWSCDNSWNLDYKARLKIIYFLKKPGLLVVEGFELPAIFGEVSCICHCHSRWCWIIRTHSETTLASSDFVGAIFLTDVSHWRKQNYKYLLRSTKLPQVTAGATWNLAGCLAGGQLMTQLMRQATKVTIFPFEICNNYSPSSGLVEC